MASARVVAACRGVLRCLREGSRDVASGRCWPALRGRRPWPSSGARGRWPGAFGLRSSWPSWLVGLRSLLCAACLRLSASLAFCWCQSLSSALALAAHGAVAVAVGVVEAEGVVEEAREVVRLPRHGLGRLHLALCGLSQRLDGRCDGWFVGGREDGQALQDFEGAVGLAACWLSGQDGLELAQAPVLLSRAHPGRASARSSLRVSSWARRVFRSLSASFCALVARGARLL